jgi:hypothetical protein
MASVQQDEFPDEVTFHVETTQKGIEWATPRHVFLEFVENVRQTPFFGMVGSLAEFCELTRIKIMAAERQFDFVRLTPALIHIIDVSKPETPWGTVTQLTFRASETDFQFSVEVPSRQ